MKFFVLFFFIHFCYNAYTSDLEDCIRNSSSFLFTPYDGALVGDSKGWGPVNLKELYPDSDIYELGGGSFGGIVYRVRMPKEEFRDFKFFYEESLEPGEESSYTQDLRVLQYLRKNESSIGFSIPWVKEDQPLARSYEVQSIPGISLDRFLNPDNEFMDHGRRSQVEKMYYQNLTKLKTFLTQGKDHTLLELKVMENNHYMYFLPEEIDPEAQEGSGFGLFARILLDGKETTINIKLDDVIVAAATLHLYLVDPGI